MAETFLNGRVTLHAGDCLDVLATLPENSIDSCCTDPPYHLTSIVNRFGGENAEPPRSNLVRDPDTLQPIIGRQSTSQYGRLSTGFMGKQWDGGDIAFRPETWAAVYRVLKPGAHLIAFGGTRTYHRMACAIEDAGFEIRDCLSWNFGSGFPKSHNINKKLSEQNAVCICDDNLRSLWQADEEISMPPETSSEGDMLTPMQRGASREGMGQARSKGIGGPQDIYSDVRPEESCMEGRGNISQSPRQLRQREIRSVPAAPEINGAGGRLRDGASTSDGAMDWSSVNADGMRSSSGSPTDEQCTDKSGIMAMQSQPQVSGAWPTCGRCGKPIVQDGLGTALKPAMELLCLARKPLEQSTVAANVLRWGTGAINVDGCRVGTGEDRVDGGASGSIASSVLRDGFHSVRMDRPTGGRWPANVIHDGSEEVVGAFPESGPARSGGVAGWQKNGYVGGKYEPIERTGYDDSGGSAARFFYSAKADTDDRLGSKHPTVKPLDLIQYLVRLITPKGGTCLDPFAGTGTTGEAAWREGMRAVLIEREPEYQADIRRRMALCLSGPDERARESIKARTKDKAIDHGPLFGGVA